jgi:hypothetical protein
MSGLNINRCFRDPIPLMLNTTSLWSLGNDIVKATVISISRNDSFAPRIPCVIFRPQTEFLSISLKYLNLVLLLLLLLLLLLGGAPEWMRDATSTLPRHKLADRLSSLHHTLIENTTFTLAQFGYHDCPTELFHQRVLPPLGTGQHLEPPPSQATLNLVINTRFPFLTWHVYA